MAAIFIRIRLVPSVNLGGGTWRRSFISWIFSVELCSVVCSLLSLSCLCLTVPPWTTPPPRPLAAPENKQPSLSFQGGVLTLRCLCPSCHLPSLFFCCRSPMARPPAMAGVLPTGSWCRQTFSVKHKHLTPPTPLRKSENTSMVLQKTADRTNGVPFRPTSRRKKNICTAFRLHHPSEFYIIQQTSYFNF